jgi:uncharacterized DUF497 family protein
MKFSEINGYIIDWDWQKNKWLKENRGVSFEMIALKLAEKDIVDIVAHSSERYFHQYILLINLENYIYAVPFVVEKENEKIFLKTIFPSRKYTKKYLEKGNKTLS